MTSETDTSILIIDDAPESLSALKKLLLPKYRVLAAISGTGRLHVEGNLLKPNLILIDVGRPVAHTATNLVGYDRLVEDAQSVLNALIPKAVEVQTTEGNWYTMRILPYRTLDNVIEGAGIIFVDITEIVRSRETILRLATIVHDTITMHDLNGCILAWILEALQEEAMGKLIRLSQAEILEPYHTQRLTQTGTVMNVWITATALLNEAGQKYAIATAERTSESKINLTKQVHDAQQG